jgi:hypothetical protein
MPLNVFRKDNARHQTVPRTLETAMGIKRRRIGRGLDSTAAPLACKRKPAIIRHAQTHRRFFA